MQKIYLLALVLIITGCNQNNFSNPNNLSNRASDNRIVKLSQPEGIPGDPQQGIESLQKRVSIVENELGLVNKNIDKLTITAYTVRDPALDPNARARGLNITFYRSDFDQGDYKKVYDVVTDENGQVQLNDVRTGDYKITFNDQSLSFRLKSNQGIPDIVGVGTDNPRLY